MNAPATLGESGQLSRGAPARARSDAAPRSAGWLASGELPTPPSSCGTSSRRSIGARGAPTTPSPSSPPLLRPYVDPLHVGPLLRRCYVAAARPRPRACCGAAWPAAAALALAPRAASTRRATLDGLACRAPSSSTSLSPRGGDGPKSTLSHRCDRVSACDSGTWPDGSARLVGRLTTWPNNLPFRRARHPFLFLPWFLQEESHHVFGTHLPEGSWQGRESPPCCVRH